MLRDEPVTELAEGQSTQRRLKQKNPPAHESFDHNIPHPGFLLARTPKGILEYKGPGVATQVEDNI